ncbi:MAG: hypothetical protein NTU79_03300 [Planctomycetota bacterium]|nr:hypothetical protein [Planctomycetota bacterium]
MTNSLRKFTAEQKAAIVRWHFARIDGIGESKIEKYADHLLPLPEAEALSYF